MHACMYVYVGMYHLCVRVRVCMCVRRHTIRSYIHITPTYMYTYIFDESYEFSLLIDCYHYHFVFPTIFFVIYQVISLIQTGNSLSADTLLNSGKKRKA